MEPIEEIKKALLMVDENPSCAEKLIQHFSNDNLFFKRIIRFIFMNKFQAQFGENVKETDLIENYFPKRWRFEEKREFELVTGLNVPKMVLSPIRWNIMLISFLVPMLLFGWLFFWYADHFFIPVTILGIGFFVFISTLPSIAIELIFPKFFNFLDWPQIKTVEDFLDYLVIKNWEKYRSDSFARTIEELKKMGILI